MNGAIHLEWSILLKAEGEYKWIAILINKEISKKKTKETDED